ncbi:MAG: hypothetical protein A3H97_10005 [Acidobacteria bacterium RIFCSPLOWO2_02_FULL_65_29]|nr:MAG: hypothetical protein A3H97_10005 [Acidobacteria bacterium RIFCSPLOWO2_02_FULL_65_29]
MPSDLLQSFIVLAAAISAMLAARFLARAIAGKPPAEAPRIPPVVPAARAPADGSATPQEVVLAQSPTPMRLLAAGRERPTRRLNLADARKGIVLATILGPCGAQSADQDHRP